MLDKETVFQTLYSVIQGSLTVAIFLLFTIFILVLVSSGFEPMYLHVSKVFKLDPLKDPGREAGKVCIKIVLVATVIIVLRSNTFLEGLFTIVDKLVKIGGVT